MYFLPGNIMLAEHIMKDYAFTGFFAIASFLLFIFLHLLGSRLFVMARESGNVGPKLFVGIMLFLGVAGTVMSCFVHNREASLLLGFLSGLLLWTAILDIPQQLGWISLADRWVPFAFVGLAALWVTGMFFYSYLPSALFGMTGYFTVVWGIELARFKIISKWGPSSPAASAMILVTAAVAGGALALGTVHGTIFSGIIGGVLFAVSIWSSLEIIWERGMAQKPWSGFKK